MYIFVPVKKSFKTLGIYLLLANFFVGTSGFMIFSHICFTEGKQEISAQKQEIDECCSLKVSDHSTEITSDCCVYDSTFLKFDFTGANSKNHETIDIDLSLLAIEISREIFSTPQTENKFQDLPPPDSGRDILLEKRVFRI